MKNNKLLIVSLCVVPLLAYAAKETNDWIKYVPLAKQEIFSDEWKNRTLDVQNQIKTKGYYETSENKTKFLFDTKRNAIKEIKEGKVSKYGIYDTSLKSNHSEIKLAFKFKELKPLKDKDIIGYAATGTYLKEKDKHGWNGITVFFNDSYMGTCSYSYIPIIDVTLDGRTIEYLVNKHPSDSLIQGNINDGFLYTIHWFANHAMYTLECANKSFDKDIMSKMIILANKIDKN